MTCACSLILDLFAHMLLESLSYRLRRLLRRVIASDPVPESFLLLRLPKSMSFYSQVRLNGKKLSGHKLIFRLRYCEGQELQNSKPGNFNADLQFRSFGRSIICDTEFLPNLTERIFQVKKASGKDKK